MIERILELSYCPTAYKNNVIVIVDDHKLVREATINLLSTILNSLELEDFSFIEASDGIDLLRIIKTDICKRIKCIFVDENMEYLNGSEAVRIIRHLESNKKIPRFNIVSTTAFDDVETRKIILEAGFDKIIQKPCSKSILKEIVGNIKI